MPENDGAIDPTREAATRAGQATRGSGPSTDIGAGGLSGLPGRVGHDIASRGGEGGVRLPSNADDGTDLDKANLRGNDSGRGIGTDVAERGLGSEEGYASAAGAEEATRETRDA